MNESFNLCGKLPFQFVKGFALTICCNSHDHAYSVLRAECLTQMLETSQLENPAWVVDSVYYFEKVKEADQQLYNCMELYLAEVGPFKKLLILPFVKSFTKIVETVGFEVWRLGTLHAWDKLEELRRNNAGQNC